MRKEELNDIEPEMIAFMRKYDPDFKGNNRWDFDHSEIYNDLYKLKHMWRNQGYSEVWDKLTKEQQESLDVFGMIV